MRASDGAHGATIPHVVAASRKSYVVNYRASSRYLFVSRNCAGVGWRGRRVVIDPFGRTISYLRVSVTDRCDFRCVYCMAEEMRFLPKAELLTLEELDRVCTAFVRQGVRKLRLTGGEPLVRKNIMSLVRG